MACLIVLVCCLDFGLVWFAGLWVWGLVVGVVEVVVFVVCFVGLMLICVWLRVGLWEGFSGVARGGVWYCGWCCRFAFGVGLCDFGVGCAWCVFWFVG